jgi:hypothetical protein
MVLDCDEQAKAFKCYASYANCPYNCINGNTFQPSKENSYMAFVEDFTTSNDSIIGVELYSSINIPANTEILVDYGEFYIYPTLL